MTDHMFKIGVIFVISLITFVLAAIEASFLDPNISTLIGIITALPIIAIANMVIIAIAGILVLSFVVKYRNILNNLPNGQKICLGLSGIFVLISIILTAVFFGKVGEANKPSPAPANQDTTAPSQPSP